MKVRFLEPEEFHLLDEHPEWEVPDPKYTRVVAAFDDNGKLVGRMSLRIVPVLDDPWIAPKHRGGTLGARMETMIRQDFERLDMKWLLAFPTRPEHGQYLQRLGYERLEMEAWGRQQ